MTRKLVGCSFIKDDGNVYIPDEINGKKNESVLVKAAQKSAADGGPALINALCGVGGADPNQRSAKERIILRELRSRSIHTTSILLLHNDRTI